MTQPENGGAIVDDAQKSGTTDTDGQNNNGEKDVQKQLEEMQAQINLLQKESAGKDKAITKYQKEIESFNLANKTAEEQLEFYKTQAEALERKETFRQAFKDNGLNPDEFMAIVDEKDAKAQAEKFAALLKSRTDESVKTALEAFKTQELQKKGGVPDPVDNYKTDPNKAANDAIRSAFKR